MRKTTRWCRDFWRSRSHQEWGSKTRAYQFLRRQMAEQAMLSWYPLTLARTGQTACKPGSVLALRRWMAIPLGRPLPSASRDRPGRRRGNTAAGCPACRPYLVLLPVGFAVPLPLPVARWALTPPFHPCRPGEPGRRSVLCGTFPGVAPAGR